VNGRISSRPIATEAAALLPLNLIGNGCPERATPAFRIGIRLIPALDLRMEQCLSTNSDRGDKRIQVHRDGGALVVVAGTKPILHRATAVTRTVRDNPRLALIPPSMSTSMEMYPMSNVVSIAQRLAEKADQRAAAYLQRAMSDNFMSEDETETYRDMRATAVEIFQYADLRDALDSAGRSGLTPRNIRRLRDYVSLDDSIA
jgi:hypothetical protein